MTPIVDTQYCTLDKSLDEYDYVPVRVFWIYLYSRSSAYEYSATVRILVGRYGRYSTVADFLARPRSGPLSNSKPAHSVEASSQIELGTRADEIVILNL